MACLCGDVECGSCGPAQGNSRCPICRVWLSTGCEHRDEDGMALPEYNAEMARAEADQAEAASDADWDRRMDEGR